jgi:hypothetical protein
MMQTASSAKAMPSPASFLAFARLNVSPGWQLCKLKHRAAQIKIKIASAPRIEAREGERWVEGGRARQDRDLKRRGARTTTTCGAEGETDILHFFSVG